MSQVSSDRSWEPARLRAFLAARLVSVSLLTALPLSAAVASSDASAPQSVVDDASGLLDMSMDQLMDLEVTSVSKKPESLNSVAAAIHVITQEDIRHSGMSSVPELLRMVPGLQVARINAHDWAIGARGYDEQFPGKLLVLVDGRSVYSPVFSGVLWDLHELPLQDIERIEVIRGPGATIWGANAVDGVINIITRNARDTPGLTVSVSGGTADGGTVAASYGGKLSDSAFYRVYVKGFKRDALRTPTDGNAMDSWRQARGGGRLDWTPSGADTVSMQAEHVYGRLHTNHLVASPAGSTTSLPSIQINRNDHALVNWNHKISPNSDLTAQVYYDSVRSESVGADIGFDTYDMEVRHHFVLGARHDVVWGGGYRRINYRSRATQILSFDPSSGAETIYNIFGQDDFALTDRLHLIAGLKLEHNSYSGWEKEPTLRLSWQIRADHSVWAAVSGAVRTPSIADEFARVNTAATPASPTAPPMLVATFGNPGVRSERLTSWQVGYRGAIHPDLTIDATGFYNRYTRSQSLAAGTPVLEVSPPPVHLLVPLRYGNRSAGELYGMEISANWRVSGGWRLSGAYSLNMGEIKRADPSLIQLVGRSPHHNAQIRSQLNLPGNIEFDAAVYYVSRFKQVASPRPIPGYARLDLRFGWQATDRLSFSLSGQNLLQSRHQEHAPNQSGPSEIPRTFSLTATAGF